MQKSKELKARSKAPKHGTWKWKIKRWQRSKSSRQLKGKPRKTVITKCFSLCASGAECQKTTDISNTFPHFTWIKVITNFLSQSKHTCHTSFGNTFILPAARLKEWAHINIFTGLVSSHGFNAVCTHAHKHKNCFSASSDFINLTFTSCLQSERQAYLYLFHFCFAFQKMSWSLSFVSSNSIKIRLFTILVKGRSVFGVLLLWKWWVLKRFKC